MANEQLEKLLALAHNNIGQGNIDFLRKNHENCDLNTPFKTMLTDPRMVKVWDDLNRFPNFPSAVVMQTLTFVPTYISEMTVVTEFKEDFLKPLITKANALKDFLDQHCNWGHLTTLPPEVRAHWDKKIRDNIDSFDPGAGTKHGRYFSDFLILRDDEGMAQFPLLLDYFSDRLNNWDPQARELMQTNGMIHRDIFKLRYRNEPVSNAHLTMRILSYFFRKYTNKPHHRLVAEITQILYPISGRTFTEDVVVKITKDIPDILDLEVKEHKEACQNPS